MASIEDSGKTDEAVLRLVESGIGKECRLRSVLCARQLIRSARMANWTTYTQICCRPIGSHSDICMPLSHVAVSEAS